MELTFSQKFGLFPQKARALKELKNLQKGLNLNCKNPQTILKRQLALCDKVQKLNGKLNLEPKSGLEQFYEKQTKKGNNIYIKKITDN